jgi:hypothetical protein
LNIQIGDLAPGSQRDRLAVTCLGTNGAFKLGVTGAGGQAYRAVTSTNLGDEPA